MLKNALLFATAALVIAFSAPYLLPQRAARLAETAKPGSEPVAVVPVATEVAMSEDSGFREASIPADAVGQFRTNALVEGQEVDMLVDTGATMVALTAETAARVGVVVDPAAPKWRMSTANGINFASPVVLKQISLGSIYMANVQAVVMPPGAATANLLGASFLKRLAGVEQRDGVLLLRQ